MAHHVTAAEEIRASIGLHDGELYLNR